MPDDIRAYLEQLDQDERAYAAAYAEHLSVGDVEPGEGGVDLERAAEIRAALRREWNRRVWTARRRRAKGGDRK